MLVDSTDMSFGKERLGQVGDDLAKRVRMGSGHCLADDQVP